MRIHRFFSAPVGALLALSVVTAVPDPASARTQIFTGQAFDTCSAPNLGTMRAWWGRSPYRGAGVYIGGAGRSCRQPFLNRGWVSSVNRMGWRLLPVYAGSQAPCSTDRHPKPVIDPRHTAQQGGGQGVDAVRSAGALGMVQGSPIYLDIENYRRNDRGCALAVLQFTSAWSAAVRARGYRAGFYSSAYSGIADLAAVPSIADLVWYGRWDSHANTDGYRSLQPGQYTGHRRVHQYRGAAKERYGGVTHSVDRDAVDSPVAIVR